MSEKEKEKEYNKILNGLINGKTPNHLPLSEDKKFWREFYASNNEYMKGQMEIMADGREYYTKMAEKVNKLNKIQAHQIERYKGSITTLKNRNKTLQNKLKKMVEKNEQN